MNDLQQRLRDAIAASVDGAEPSCDLMSAVRRRHRQRLRRLAAAGAAAVMVAAATMPGKQHQPAPLFPGRGRLLLADAGTLRWLYPDGTTTRIPGRFDGA